MITYHKNFNKNPNRIIQLLQLDFLTGLFMASRVSIIACGTRMAFVAMAMKFLMGPALMALSSTATGLKGRVFREAIVQVHIICLLVKSSILPKSLS
jgi:hypothetical protein